VAVTFDVARGHGLLDRRARHQPGQQRRGSATPTAAHSSETATEAQAEPKCGSLAVSQCGAAAAAATCAGRRGGSARNCSSISAGTSASTTRHRRRAAAGARARARLEQVIGNELQIALPAGDRGDPFASPQRRTRLQMRSTGLFRTGGRIAPLLHHSPATDQRV
jgi:hypothetical protein